jgi:APA family basic amino acid/polyamine antiporter
MINLLATLSLLVPCLQVTFGELPAFCALAGLGLEWGLGMAAIARGFSHYLGELLNQDPQAPPFEFNVAGSSWSFDVFAAAIVLLISILLSLGVQESAYFNTGGEGQVLCAEAGRLVR